MLYNDALKDRVESVRAAATAEQALLSVKNSNLQLSIAEVKAQLEVARARGENAKVMRLERELRQLELQQLALNAEAKRAESRATRAQAEATRASQIALNQWTPAAEAAFKASVAKAEALENEAKIADITINKLKELATITKQSGNAARSAATDYDNLAESLSGVGEAADSAARSASRVGSDSGSGSSGSVGSSGGGSLIAAPRAIQQLRLKQQAGTLSESDLELAKQALEEAQFLSNTAGAFGFRNAGEADDQLVEARRIFESLQSRQSQAGTTQQAAPNRASQGFSVSINLNGSATQVNTASQRDAENLVGIFRQLESASATVTLTLHPDLYWSDENSWVPVEQSVERTITGALIVSAAERIGGRNITLQPDDDSSAWMPQSTVEQLRNWAAVPGKELTLTLRGTDRTVIFRHHDGDALVATPVVHYNDVDSGDFYRCTLRLMEL